MRTTTERPDTAVVPSSARRRQRAIEQLAAGGAIVLCDRIDAPARGEVVFAAAHATRELMAFAVRHGSGFIQVALPESRCDELRLPPMTTAAASGGEPCLGVTVDAAEGISTGISAADRARTARLLADPGTRPDDLCRPGHTVPIRARPGGAGLADAALELAVAAGETAAVVLSSVVGVVDPTQLAAGAELADFARCHGLPLAGADEVLAAGASREQTWANLCAMSQLLAETPSLLTALGPEQVRQLGSVCATVLEHLDTRACA
ncbi:MAG TPA: 3,4-dihydroxy-2-butanone-4-phosphate synthase [Amycolatopsis sp.]|nr:3,4-dihydroxy-2-butanone-4-phosphate synthase [Amycolatopsis sp.]